MAAQIHPIYIVSVNNTPPRAKELIAILVDELKLEFNLIHLANVDTIFGVKAMLESLVIVPEVLICSSQWNVAQQNEVQKLAEKLVPGLKTIAIPSGLDVLRGGDAVVGFLKEQFLGLGLPAST